MAMYRPTGVLVIAILNLIGGTLGVLGGLYAFAMLAIGNPAMMFGTPPTPPPGANQQAREIQEFSKKIEDVGLNPPGGKGLQFAQTSVDMILSILMVVSGIGLIKMQSWARTLAITYAIGSILMHLYQVVYLFGFMIPAFQAIIDAGPKGNQFVDMFGTMMKAVLIITAVITFLFTAYPITVLIILCKSSTAAAFRGEYVDPYAPKPLPDVPADDYDDRFRSDEPDDRYRADER